MLETSIKEEIDSLLDKLNPEAQRRVLEFTRSLSPGLPKGLSGIEFRQFAGLIPPDDLALMAAAIEEGCENIDLSEW